MFRKLAAECFGTFWLVFGGCGSAVLAAAFPGAGNWFCRRSAGIWFNRINDGLRCRAYFWWAF